MSGGIPETEAMLEYSSTCVMLATQFSIEIGRPKRLSWCENHSQQTSRCSPGVARSTSSEVQTLGTVCSTPNWSLTLRTTTTALILRVNVCLSVWFCDCLFFHCTNLGQIFDTHLELADVINAEPIFLDFTSAGTLENSESYGVLSRKVVKGCPRAWRVLVNSYRGSGVQPVPVTLSAGQLDIEEVGHWMWKPCRARRSVEDRVKINRQQPLTAQGQEGNTRWPGKRARIVCFSTAVTRYSAC